MRLDLKSYNQRDPRWSNVKINTTSSTLGRYGCTITIIGDLFNKNPRDANAWLKSLKAFSPIDGEEDLVLWSKVPFWKWRFYCKRVPAPMADIKARLRARKPVLLQVSFQKNWKKPNHWVLATGYSGNTIYINDPWYGDKSKLVPRYGTTSSLAILGGSYFDKKILPPKPPAPPKRPTPPKAPKDPCASLKIEIQTLKNDMDVVQGNLEVKEKLLLAANRTIEIQADKIKTSDLALGALKFNIKRLETRLDTLEKTIRKPVPKLSAVEHLTAWWNIIFNKKRFK